MCVSERTAAIKIIKSISEERERDTASEKEKGKAREL